MNALVKARRALGTLRVGPSAVEVAEVLASVNPKFFVVPETLKADPIPVEPVDISETIANAAKEAASMTEIHATITDSFRASIVTHKETIVQARERIVMETDAADAEHKAQIERLNDEIRTRNEAHTDFVNGQNERLADADKTLSAINASLDNLDGVKPDKPARGTKPVAVQTTE